MTATTELHPGTPVDTPVGRGRVLGWAHAGWEVMVRSEVQWFPTKDLRPVDRAQERKAMSGE